METKKSNCKVALPHQMGQNPLLARHEENDWKRQISCAIAKQDTYHKLD